MSKFLTFENRARKDITINTSHIVSAQKNTNNTNETILVLTNGDKVSVRARYSQVQESLEAI